MLWISLWLIDIINIETEAYHHWNHWNAFWCAPVKKRLEQYVPT